MNNLKIGRFAKRITACAAVCALLAGAQAQADDPVVMSVAGRDIHKSEFMKDFHATARPEDVAADKQKALREYANLYAVFQAKLVDARAMGLDTMPALVRELDGYRSELALPYLVDSASLDELMKEAYERNHYYLHAAHILVPAPENMAPADTLKAYNHIIELRNRILAGEDFYAVSREEVGNQRNHDERMPVHDNEGDLGYFTVFNMVYPFETGAYALQVGDLSMPVRSQYGYHIIKLFDRQAIGGRVQVAHIWQNEGKDKSIIDGLYARLENGESFENVARRSDDNTTADKGGVMPELNLNQLLPEYVEALRDLKPGQYSKPFHTQFGWHIVKFISTSELPSLDELRPRYMQYMGRDERIKRSRKSFADRCRVKYNAIDYTQTPVPQKANKGKKKKQPTVMMASLDELEQILNDTVFRGKWYYDETKLADLRPMANVNGVDYTIKEVARFIYDTQKRRRPMLIKDFAREQMDLFVDSMAIGCQKADLEKDYPDFAEVVDGYRRGLMIFSYNDQMVWSKAAQDSAGYEQFYQRESAKKSLDNLSDTLYFWKSRARVLTVTVPDSNCLAPKKALKLAKKAVKKNLASGDVRQLFRSNFAAKCSDASASTGMVLIEKGTSSSLVDSEWKPGIYIHPLKKGYVVLIVQEIIEPMLKSSTEARGFYLSAYQNEVEQRLDDHLRSKYNVHINWDEINKITF